MSFVNFFFSYSFFVKMYAHNTIQYNINIPITFLKKRLLTRNYFGTGQI